MVSPPKMPMLLGKQQFLLRKVSDVYLDPIFLSLVMRRSCGISSQNADVVGETAVAPEEGE